MHDSKPKLQILNYVPETRLLNGKLINTLRITQRRVWLSKGKTRFKNKMKMGRTPHKKRKTIDEPG